MNELLDHIRTLERELHKSSVRHTAARLDALLHDDFIEFGRSGRVYSKREILDCLPAAPGADIVAGAFSLKLLAPDVALLTYRSANKSDDGSFAKQTLRTSIWQQSTGHGWQIIFHQGTPA